MRFLSTVVLSFIFTRSLGTSIDDQELESYRLAHGQTVDGEPFYMDRVQMDKFSRAHQENGGGGIMDLKQIQGMHEYFLASDDAEASDAVWQGWLQVCTLVEAFTDVRGCIQAPSKETGFRATHLAAINGWIRKLSWLAAFTDTDFDAVTAPNAMGKHTGFSPCHEAALHGQMESLLVLEKVGANLYQPSAGGWTPLQVALKAKNKKVAKWLRERGKDEAEDFGEAYNQNKARKLFADGEGARPFDHGKVTPDL